MLIARVKAILRRATYDKAVVNGEVRYIRVTASAIKKGLVTKAPKRTWKKGDEKKGEAKKA